MTTDQSSTNNVRICLTFDVDAYSPIVFERGDANAAAMSRGEFDTRVGVPRLLALLRDLEVTATFFVPGHTADCFPATVESILEAGHEIGHHGYLHEPPARLTADKEAEALDRGLESLQRHA